MTIMTNKKHIWDQYDLLNRQLGINIITTHHTFKDKNGGLPQLL